MFWDKKKSSDSKGLPDLPSYSTARPSLAEIYRNPSQRYEEESEEIHSLPSFPDSPMKKGFAQSAIKDAVQHADREEELPHLPEHDHEEEHLETINPAIMLPRQRVVEMEEWRPRHNQPLPRSQVASKRSVEDKPVFVRLDKFQSGKESLEIIRDKITEIDSLLQSIREVKMKEDQEILAWEKEMESVKARINSVTTEIFESGID